MTNFSEQLSRRATEQRIAAGLIYEGKLKEFVAVYWSGGKSNVEQASAAVHSALDAVLDGIKAQVDAFRTLHDR